MKHPYLESLAAPTAVVLSADLFTGCGKKSDPITQAGQADKKAGIKENFYQYLDAALQFVPVTPEDKAIRARLASIGIGPGRTFSIWSCASTGRRPNHLPSSPPGKAPGNRRASCR